ncbi:hypothetical protein N7540_003362 [Penicillium herquei]|nr:hypothetical protein N7540_003362 [Penicillium herquei]
MAYRNAIWGSILLVCLVLIQGIAGQSAIVGALKTPDDCTSDNIQNNNLGNCQCHGSNNVCDNVCPAVPSGLTGCAKANSQTALFDCAASCSGEHNHCCSSCWIWFQAVCTCKQSGGCITSGPNTPNWIKLNSELASTSILLTNILQLQSSQQALATALWDFGQQKASDPSTQALAINSAHSITESQIHLHICTPNDGMKNFLTGLYQGHSSSPTFYNVLRDIPNPYNGERMFCRASQIAKQTIPGGSIFDDINTVLKRSDTCDYYVGAAVIRDNNGYSWVCVTEDNLSTEKKRFCA